MYSIFSLATHQPVSLLVVDINESLRVLIWSEWVPFFEARSGSFRLGDVDLLLVTFNSELKIFDSLLNNQASGEHSQCYCEVGNIIAREICELVLNNKEKHVLDVIDTKMWKVAFLESVNVGIGSSYYNLFQMPGRSYFSSLCLCNKSRVGHCRNSSLQRLEIIVEEVVNWYFLMISTHNYRKGFGKIKWIVTAFWILLIKFF
ncbi:hypothetical protein Tco_1371628 [Tanacetum coccineum]